jgi:ATP-dependent Lhr-like helicase
VQDLSGARWWTWAGGRANAVIAAAFDHAAPGIVEAMDRYDDRYLRVRSDVSARGVSDGLAQARDRFGPDLGGVEPDVTEEAVRALKFAELLPPQLAHETLAARLGDHVGAAQIANRRVRAG